MARFNPRDAARADRLDRYWDEVVLGRPGATPDPNLDPTSAQVLRSLEALGDTRGSTGASERVWRQIQAAGLPQAQTVAITPIDVNGQEPTTESVPEPTPIRRSVNLWRLNACVAAAIIVVLLGGYVAGWRLPPEITDLWRDSESPSLTMSRGGPARTGEHPGPGPASVPVVQWQVETGAVAPSSPGVADGVVYVGTYERALLALDASTGSERWRFETEGAIGGSPAVADSVVYVGDEAGNLYAVDASTGEQVWRVDLGNSLYTASPAVVDGVVYLTSGAGGTAPAVIDGVVYAGGDGAASRSAQLVHAVDATKGEERWRHNVQLNGLFALDAETGDERWHFSTFASVYHSSPVVADGNVYFGTRDGNVYAVDTATGQERWSVQTGSAVYASPAVVDGLLYVGSTDGFLYALDAATGEEVWRLEIGVVDKSSPAVVDGVVYTVGGNYLWAVNTETGNEHWRVATGGDGAGSPVVIDGTVYVGGRITTLGGTPTTGSGVLFALSEDPGP